MKCSVDDAFFHYNRKTEFGCCLRDDEGTFIQAHTRGLLARFGVGGPRGRGICIVIKFEMDGRITLSRSYFGNRLQRDGGPAR